MEKPYLLVASVSAGSNLLYQLEEVDTSKFHYIDLNEWSNPENASVSSTYIQVAYILITNILK